MPANRVILNAIFPGDPLGYKRVEFRGGRGYVPDVMRAAQKRLRTALKRIAPTMKVSNVYFGVQQVFHLAPCEPTAEPDGDNLEKLLWDAFEGKIWINDRLITEWTGKKVRGSLTPHTHLIVYVIEN